MRDLDFDHVGVLWLSDLVHRDGRWVVQLDHVHESGLDRSLAAAKKEAADGPAHEQLCAAVAQAYRILLTRGLETLDLWFENEATRRHVEHCMGVV